MISLARLILIHDWKRFLAAVLAVAFSGLLVLVQIGLLLGQLGTTTVVMEQASADLWVVAPNTESFDLAREMPLINAIQLYMHPGVAIVDEMIFGFGDWRTKGGGKIMVSIIGLNLAIDSLGFPHSFTSEYRQLLQEPGSVIIDVVDINKLKTGLQQYAEINGNRVHVVGITSGFRAIGGAYVFASLSTARDLMDGLMQGDYTNFFLVGLQQGADIEKLRDELQPEQARPPFSVLTPQQLAEQSQYYWMTETGSGASFGFSALLAMMVGVAITSQTLRAAILASIREYATLRALGVSVSKLRRVVLEQAFWVGMVGLALTGILTYAIFLLANTYHVAIRFPWWSFVGCVLFMLFVSLTSGVLALKALYKTEPADLLR